MSLDPVAREVLTQFPEATHSPPEPLLNHGGFSGARIWRVSGYNGPLCLKAWPVGFAPGQLAFVHEKMALAQPLHFVPRASPSRGGALAVTRANRLWDLTTWMPGKADFDANPSTARIERACAALAALHQKWHRTANVLPCPAVQRRLERWRYWTNLVASGWKPTVTVGPFANVVPRAWQILLDVMPRIPAALTPWQMRPLPVQPCLCDVWHDHVLFSGDDVTGLVDFGGMKVDNVAVDLARMLGSMVGDDTDMVAAGLSAYRQIRPLDQMDEELIRVLDFTGVIFGAANWLLWVCHERRAIDDVHAAAMRLEKLADRLAKLNPREWRQ